jgi:hypothetical protein
MRTRVLSPLLVCLIATTGCQTAFADHKQSDDKKKCTGYGFQPGTDKFAECMMKLDEKRENAAADAKDDDARMKALSIKRNGDTRFPICSAAMMDANLDTVNNAWYGPNCRQK